MDDGSQKLLDVIDDPSALESFLGLNAAAAGETSSQTTLESLVDSIQQGLLDPNTTAGGGSTSARHASAGAPQTTPAGSLVLTHHQLQQIHQFQAGSTSGRPQGVAFTLPSHGNNAPVVSSSPPVSAVVTSSSTHHFVLTPFHHAGSNTTHHSSHPITLINANSQQGNGTLVSTTVSQPSSSFISASTTGTISHPTNQSLTIGHGGAILAASTAGLHVGGTVASTSIPVIGSTAVNQSMPNLASNSIGSSGIFGASIIPTANSSTGSSVLVGPSGTTVFTPTISSPGSPFSVPTRSPAAHAPPTPSPSPLPLRSPASVPSHHPPSPAPSPYHTQLQSPQQQPLTNVPNTSFILSTNGSQAAPASMLKEHYGGLQSHNVSSSQTTPSFVLSTANTTFKEVYNMQQTSSQPTQPSVVVLPQQRSNISSNTSNTSPTPTQSSYSSLQSPVAQHTGTVINQHLVSTRSPAPVGAQPVGALTSGGTLTPAPSPSPQTGTAASPVIRSTTPQPTVIHQALPSGLTISGGGQFPVMPPSSATMLQGNHQLVQIIHHHTAAQQTSTFPAHTQIITTVPGGTVPLQQAATTVGGPPKAKQPPQILPKPPSGQPTGNSHSKIVANARASSNTQQQGIHAQHHATAAAAAQVVIGQANPTTMIPAAQAGTLLVNQVIPGLAPSGPVLVQPNPSGGVQLILRSPTTSTQTATTTQGSPQNQHSQQGKTQNQQPQPPPPMFISGAATAQILHNTGRQQIPQVLRLITAQGPIQLQQIQTPSGPTFIAVPSGQTLSFQQLGPHTSTPTSAAPPPHPTTVPTHIHQIHSQPHQGQRPATSQQQQSISSSQQTAPPLHQSNGRPTLTSATSCTPQQCVSAVIGGHSLSIGAANNATPAVIQQNNNQHAQLDITSAQTNSGFSIVRHNQTVLAAQQHQCTGTNTEQQSLTAIPQKKKQKKKKKKKKDEEPKLDLANIMKLSGIGDDEDLTLYETEELQVATSSQSPVSVEQSPVNQQQSQLITQLRSPPQVPSQNGSNGTTSLRLAVEDGHVVLHHAPAPPNSQHSTANLLLHNLPSTISHQQNVTTAQNQLSALLGSSAPGNTNNHIVLSHLLQQSSPSGLLSHLTSNTNCSNIRVTNSTSPNSPINTLTTTMQSQSIQQPQQQEKFTLLHQQSSKPGFLKDPFTTGELSNSSVSKLDGNINSTNSSINIQEKSPSGPLSLSSLKDGLMQAGSNKMNSSTSTCLKSSSTPPLSLHLTHESPSNLFINKSSHQNNCQSDITLKPSQDAFQKQNSTTTQTEILHPNIHLGNKQHDSNPFIPTSKHNSDGGPTFLGIHPFSTIQGLVSTTGTTIPLVTTPVMTSGGSNFGGEQLLIAHHGGMSVLAAPQLIQCLQQAQNAAPGLINMSQLHLTPNAINKAIGQGLTINTQAGTILIGGSPETFSATMNSQHKPSLVTPTSNNAATKLLPQQPSVLLQQLNAGTGTSSSLRRCSSDSNNSSISIGSPPPGGGVSTGGTTAVIGLINQPVVSHCSSSVATSGGPRKNQQSIETQTISLGIPTTNSFQNSFLETITHPNLVLSKLTQSNKTVTGTPCVTAAAAAIVAAAQAVTIAGKKKKTKQQRSTKILPVVTTASRQYNSTATTTESAKNSYQERNFVKPSTISQGTQHVSQSVANDSPPYVTTPPFTLSQQTTRYSNTSAMTTVPPLNTICAVGNTTTTTVTTTTMLQSVMSKVAANISIQAGIAEVSTNNHHSLTSAASKQHCVASQTVSMQQPLSGLVPHLVPIPSTGNTGTPAVNSIIQKVQTIQLTPQNQKHLKAVQLQIQTVQGKKVLAPGDQVTLHRLYEEQQRILLTGKVVPTIPGQHAVGLPLVQHQNPPLPVRYQHQVGNQIIPLTPANLQQKPAPLGSVATTTTPTTSTTTTRASISVQCGTSSDGLIQQSVGLSSQIFPKLSIVQPILQASSQSNNKNSGQSPSSEKRTSPLQVQVGTQTALPCLDAASTGSSHLSTPIALCTGKISPSSSSCKISPMPAQQLFSPGKQVQPIFGAMSSAASSSKIQTNFSPTGSSKSCTQPTMVGCKILTGGIGKPQAVISPVSPTSSATSSSSPVMVTVAGTTKRPTVTSPIRPSFSRSDLIEQQLKTDQTGACMPETSTPFQSTSDACKRLIRYHVFNEQLLSQQDLEKADEIFEATAKHLLDKFRQMMNKYRYLLLMESMHEVNTSELVMLDRMFVAEEEGLLERMKEEECRIKEEPVVPAEQQPSSPHAAGVLTTVKTEPGLPTSSGIIGSSSGDGLKEVRVVVQDVMKNESIKRELEEDRKFTVVKRERLDTPAGNKEVHQVYDEWEEIQKELAVYCGPNNNIQAAGGMYTPAIKIEGDEATIKHMPGVTRIKPECESLLLDRTDKKVSSQRSDIDSMQKLGLLASSGTKIRSGSCDPRDEGGGTEDENDDDDDDDDDYDDEDDDDDDDEDDDDDDDDGGDGGGDGGDEEESEIAEEVNRNEDNVGEKRKEFCDTNVDAVVSIGHRKKRHKHGYSPQHKDCEDDDINAQVQCAINSILNLQRSEDGFDIRPITATPTSEVGVRERLDIENSRQFECTKVCSVRSRHKRSSASCKTTEQAVVIHHEDNTDSALDEAVRSILTS